MVLLSFAKISGKADAVSFSETVSLVSLPALCYFVSNNCALFIVRELGPTIYQITCNLKVFATVSNLASSLVEGLLASLEGSRATCHGNNSYTTRNGWFRCIEERYCRLFLCDIELVCSRAGGVLSEKLLKGSTCEIRFTGKTCNCIFGLLYGLVMSLAFPEAGLVFSGFNVGLCMCSVCFGWDNRFLYSQIYGQFCKVLCRRTCVISISGAINYST